MDAANPKQPTVPSALYSPPSHPTTLGNVWIGSPSPSPSVLAAALVAKAEASVQLSDKPRNKWEPQYNPLRVTPEEEDDVREGFAEIERGEGIALTPEEAERWAETGELPEHVK